MCEKNIDLLPQECAPIGDLTYNLGMNPGLGLKPANFWGMGRCYNQLSHPARVGQGFFYFTWKCRMSRYYRHYTGKTFLQNMYFSETFLCDLDYI